MTRLSIFKIIIFTFFIFFGNNNAETSLDATSVDSITLDPTTTDPTTLDPITPNPTTLDPITPNPTTPNPTTLDPTTLDPITPNPTTLDPTTLDPTTLDPITPNPTTLDPTTPNPTTLDPTTPNPTTPNPTTPDPTTPNPTTLDPTTPNPTTPNPTTLDPTTPNPTTPNPTTLDPITPNPTTLDPTTSNPITPDPTTSLPTSTPESSPIILLDDYQIEVLWTPKYQHSVIFKTDEDYKISVRIENCDLDGAIGEYVTIGTGKANESLLFSYRVKSKPTYLFNSDELYVDFEGKHFQNFTATFTRVGNGVTTTSTTEMPTTQNWPTQSSNESNYLTVFIAGENAMRYKEDNIRNFFRTQVSLMAADYCDNENFDLTQDITINNVYISKVVPCSPNWPKHDTCAEITFSVPIFLNESIDSRWIGYQLNRNHLQIMWDRYSKKYFNDILTNYEEPQLQIMLTVRIVLISLVTVSFVIGLMAVRFFTRKRGRAELGDKDPIISSVDNDSQFNLDIPYFQETPPLFENMYSNYNPEQVFENLQTTTLDLRKDSSRSKMSEEMEVSTA